MARNELKKAVEAALPKGWRLAYLDLTTGWLKVTCPIVDRFEVELEAFNANVERIAKAANAAYVGGGAMVGGDRYDCFFHLND